MLLKALQRIQNPVSKEVTVQVRLAVPYIKSPDLKESGLFYVQKIMLKGFYMAATAHALHILVKHKEIAEDIIKQ